MRRNGAMFCTCCKQHAQQQCPSFRWALKSAASPLSYCLWLLLFLLQDTHICACHIHTCTCVHTRAEICTKIHVCTHTEMCVHIHSRAHTSVHIYTRTHIAFLAGCSLYLILAPILNMLIKNGTRQDLVHLKKNTGHRFLRAGLPVLASAGFASHIPSLARTTPGTLATLLFSGCAEFSPSSPRLLNTPPPLLTTVSSPLFSPLVTAWPFSFFRP